MSTQSWSSRLRHDSDANYREWRDELITKLGLLLAVDETNITPGSGVRPAVGTDEGYAVFHLDDSLHSTAPIYLRFAFGTGASNGPRIRVTVGTATNGSGTLSGTGSAVRLMGGYNNAATTDTAYQSYACKNEGFFGLVHKSGMPNGNNGSFWICRTADGSGAITTTGAMMHFGSGNTGGFTGRRCVRYAATAVAYTETTTVVTGQLGFAPQAPVNSAVGADVQAFMGWMISPRVSPLLGICGVYQSELAVGGTFSVALVGTTPRTYITLAREAGPFSAEASTSADGYLNQAMLWE